METTSTDPAAVKRALRALAEGEASPIGTEASTKEQPATELSAPPAAIVDRATEALTRIELAASFVAEGGLEKLEIAIAVAEQKGDRTIARSGQRALATVQRYRQVADGQGTDEDHFHPGRGTVFSPGCQRRPE